MTRRLQDFDLADPTARLVAADWLDEQGRHDEAALARATMVGVRLKGGRLVPDTDSWNVSPHILAGVADAFTVRLAWEKSVVQGVHIGDDISATWVLLAWMTPEGMGLPGGLHWPRTNDGYDQPLLMTTNELDIMEGPWHPGESSRILAAAERNAHEFALLWGHDTEHGFAINIDNGLDQEEWDSLATRLGWEKTVETRWEKVKEPGEPAPEYLDNWDEWRREHDAPTGDEIPF